MRRRRTLVVVLVAGGLLAAACDSSDQPDEPGLDRIDGPARVDPSFDPFATVPVTDGG